MRPRLVCPSRQIATFNVQLDFHQIPPCVLTRGYEPHVHDCLQKNDAMHQWIPMVAVQTRGHEKERPRVKVLPN